MSTSQQVPSPSTDIAPDPAAASKAGAKTTAPGSSNDETLRTPKGQTPPDMPHVALNILESSVRATVGRDDVAPRPGQAKMLADIVTAYATTFGSDQEIGGQAQGEGPVGVGKSFAYLSAAAAAAALLRQRTVVSTEMISLQTQLIDKDAPVVAAACEQITGYRPQVALLKGWGNYACTNQAVDAAEEMVGFEAKTGLTKIQALREKMKKHLDNMPVVKRPRFYSGAMPEDAEREKAELIVWALDEAASLGEKRPDKTGDKNTYEGSLTDSFTWDAVSVSSADCIGADKCAMSDYCLPRKAREAAADADIIVTNHHLLAVQAAKNVPVVVGSNKVGEVQHLVIDEAHGLPSIVRSQGSVEVSGRVMKRAAKAITRVLDDGDTKVANLVKDGEAIGDYIDMELNGWTKKIKRGEDVFRLGLGDDPVNDSTDLIERWCTNARDLLKAAEKATANVSVHMKIRKVRNVLDGLSEAVRLVAEHNPGTARWVEVVTPHSKANDQTPYPSAKYTPVDVSQMLKFSLWTVEDKEAVEEEADVVESDNVSGPAPRKALSVIALSGTIPKGFGRQMGMKAPLVKYESPYDGAYGASVLFVPRASNGSEEVEALRRPVPGKPKFDTSRHTDWASGHVLDLVEANGGSALVLAATATAGRVYAERLAKAAKGRWNVLSQWDGTALRKQVADWKSDTNSVLVGTKSLMTGVDASGATCTLVIVDRPARSRSNPVDDARVEMLMNDAQMDKWAADRLVYVSDAGMLLEQASGRLIRSITDSGMVAVLDPRLLKTSPFSYNEATRKDYLECLHRFKTKIADPAAAQQWLRDHRAALAARGAA